jgi:hypothetical protein
MDSPLPKREYNPPPPADRLVSTATVPLVKPDHVSVEIESIKRTLYNAIDKLERIQRGNLTTT